MKIIAIPARLASTRFPRKPLVEIKGVPLIIHTVRKAKLLLERQECDAVYLVTDSLDIANCVAERDDGGTNVWVDEGSRARNGTERLAAFAINKRLPDDAWIVNLQGDAPLTPDWVLSRLLSWPDHSVIATAVAWQERVDGDAVVTLGLRRGMTFADRFWRSGLTRRPGPDNPLHVGVYGYSVAMLKQYLGSPQSLGETFEALEQIRWLGMGHDVAVAAEIAPGARRIAEVNRPEDTHLVAQLMDMDE